MTRPFVFLHMAMTIDGKITSYRREKPTFTSRYDRQRVHMFRQKADALLVGAATLRAENPPISVGGGTHIVVTRSGNIDPHWLFFAQGTRHIIATTVNAQLPHSGAEIWRLGETNVDVEQLCQKLHAEGVKQLLVEGGGEVAWSMLQAGVVDEFFVTITPAILGGTQAPTLVDGEGLLMATRLKLELLEYHVVKGEIFCRYRVGA